MNKELEHVASQLARATRPEDVFGDISDGKGDTHSLLRRIYYALAKVTHPDVYQIPEEKMLAQIAFTELVEWFCKADEKIRSGRYGQTDRTILQTGTREYELAGTFSEDGDFILYPCTFFERGLHHQALIRIVRDPRKNDDSQNEARILNILLQSTHAEKFSPYLPNLLDAFIYEDGIVSRQAAVFEKTEGWYSLEEVHRVYPRGIDPRDMAWMWRRLLVALGFAHSNSVIHGAVLPGNVWIQPEQHGLMLRNWFCAVHNPDLTGGVIAKIEPRFAAWYPDEILNYAPPSFGTDIGMSAKCMIYLLGGDVERKMIPASIPKPMQMFLKGSILPGTRTPQDAWAVKLEFDDLLDRLWGERKFHPFKMSFSH